MASIKPNPSSLPDGTRTVKGKVTPIAESGGMQYVLPPANPPVSGYILNPPNLTLQQLESVWGDSGTQRWSGFFYEEPNAQMRDWDRIENIEEMRRTDGAVKAALTAVKAPILATDWRVEGDDQKVVDFVNDNIFKMRRPFKDFVRESHNYLDFGFSIFEKIWEKRGEYICLADLEPRIQHSIFRFRMSSGAPGITQVVKTDEFPRAYAEIPSEKIIILTNEKEGDDITGQSILRAAWKHYKMKDLLYRIQGISAERNGVGTPWVELPDGFADEEKQAVEEMLSNYRSNEKSYIATPPGYKLSILTPGRSNSGTDIIAGIQHHNSMIFQTVLATFMNLGTDGTGSLALSKDQSSFFLKVVEDKCGYFTAQFNKQVIEPLVRLNFGPDVDVPELKFSPLGDINFLEMAQTITALAGANAIEVDGTFKQFIAKMFKLPELSDDDVAAIDADISEQVTEAPDLDSMGRPVQPNNPAGGSKGGPELLKPPTPFNVNGPANPGALPANKFKGKAKPNMTKEDKMAKPGENLEETLEARAYKPTRELTLQEKRGDFAELNDQFNQLQAKLHEKLSAHGDAAAGMIAKDAKDKIDNNDFLTIGAAALTLFDPIKSDIGQIMVEARTYGATLAAKELANGGITAVTGTMGADELRFIDLQASAIADDYLSKLTMKARSEAIAGASVNASPSAIASKIRVTVQAEADKMEQAITGSVVAHQINGGRRDTFDTYATDISQYQRSEVIDDRTCAFCLSLDGRVLTSDDPLTILDAFHYWCRGVWVPILATDEQLKPDPLPKSLTDNLDLVDGKPVINGFVQPKKAITATSAAAAQANKSVK